MRTLRFIRFIGGRQIVEVVTGTHQMIAKLMEADNIQIVAVW